jgi:hypothetical protein
MTEVELTSEERREMDKKFIEYLGLDASLLDQDITESSEVHEAICDKLYKIYIDLLTNSMV